MAAAVLAGLSSLRTASSELPESIRSALRRRLMRALEGEQRTTPTREQRALDARADEPTGSVLPFATARAFPARGTALLGGDFAFLAVLSAARLLVDAEVLLGSQEISDHAGLIAHMQLVWLNAGLSVLWASKTRPELLFGPYVRAGYGIASASQVRTPVNYKSDGAPTAALGISVFARAAMTSDVDLWVGFDLGYVTSGVLSLTDQNRSAGLADVTTALRAGLALKL